MISSTPSAEHEAKREVLGLESGRDGRLTGSRLDYPRGYPCSVNCKGLFRVRGAWDCATANF